MKRELKEKIVYKMKFYSSSKLIDIRNKFYAWDHNHTLKKNSWVWSENGNVYERARKEDWHTFSDELRIGSMVICYSSYCSMSWRNACWTDGLWIENYDTCVTFGDIAYLIEAINAILDARTKRQKT